MKNQVCCVIVFSSISFQSIEKRVLMMTFSQLFTNFFTHKDFLPPADQLPGTMFTPLHLIFSAASITIVIVLALRAAKKGEDHIRKVYGILWGILVILEIVKIT